MAEVTMSTKDAINLLGAIDKLSSSVQDFPTKFLYALSKTKNKLNHVSESYADVSSQLYIKHKLKGKEREDYTETDTKNLLKIDHELGEILKTEVSIEIYSYPSNIFFEEVDKMKPTPGYTLILDFILDANESK